MKKNILFLTHVGSPGGAEFKMIDFCESQKYQSTVVYFQNGLLKNILDKNNVRNFLLPIPDSLKSFKKDDGIKTIIRAVIPSLKMMRALAKKCKKYDVIVCMSQKSFILAVLTKPFVRKPIIWMMNDALTPEYFNKTIIKIINIFAKIFADKVILNSEYSLDAWNKNGLKKNNIYKIYPGTDFKNIDNKISDIENIQKLKLKYSSNQKPLIGIFGRITSWKGQDIFLNALAQIPEINGIIVGDALFGEEEYKNSLISLTHSLKIKDRITFTGHLDNIPSVMGACDIIVHCSTLPEPFGLVIVEALATKTPTIASNAGGAKEIIQQGITGLLTNIKDVESLKQAIQKYLDNPQIAKEMSKKANKYVRENFSKEKMIESFEIVINS